MPRIGGPSVGACVGARRATAAFHSATVRSRLELLSAEHRVHRSARRRTSRDSGRAACGDPRPGARSRRSADSASRRAACRPERSASTASSRSADRWRCALERSSSRTACAGRGGCRHTTSRRERCRSSREATGGERLSRRASLGRRPAKERPAYPTPLASRCEHGPMLRPIVLCLAISGVVAAVVTVALAEPPAPTGPREVHIVVRNETPRQVEVDGKTRTGRPSGAVLPTWVEAGSTADMTWYIPPGDGAIVVDGSDVSIDASLIGGEPRGCTAEVEVAVKAMLEISIGCSPRPSGQRRSLENRKPGRDASRPAAVRRASGRLVRTGGALGKLARSYQRGAHSGGEMWRRRPESNR
jgi:hypothetical protein